MLFSSLASSDNVSMPMSARSEIISVFRAVAKTRHPFDLNSRAREWPMPPGEQPVIKTDFGIVYVDVSQANAR
jgi:hypothetical protein